MGVFTGCQIALELGSELSFKDKQALRKLLTDNDCVVSYVITKKCTHLVTNKSGESMDTYKCRTALKQGTPVVSVNFIYDSLRIGTLQDTDPYVAAGKTKAQEFGCGRIVATTKEGKVKRRKTPVMLNLDKIEVWNYRDKKGPSYDEDHYELAKSVVLKKADYKSKMHHFCVLEIHAAPEPRVSTGDGAKYRIFCHHGDGIWSEPGDIGRQECRFTDSATDAVDIYSQLYHKYTDPPNSYVKTKEILSPNIGSDKFQQMQDEYCLSVPQLSTEVRDLVEHIWQEAVGELNDILAAPIETIRVDQVEKAEAGLVELKMALDKGRDTKELSNLSREFYSNIPLKAIFPTVISDKKTISQLQQICQLIKDMISVSESTNWSIQSSIESKYRALRCHIQILKKDDTNYENIVNIIKKTAPISLKVENLFSLHRSLEHSVFTRDIDNVKLLYHSSRAENFVGILSRGLLLPKVVVDDLGGQRTDAGMLGCGIYFTDSTSTSAKYSRNSKTKGTRLMLITNVALGNCKEYHTRDLLLTAPPDGYDSVHGVKKSENIKSEFEDDEFVIFKTNHQKMLYLVEFTLQDDHVRSIVPQSRSQEAEGKNDVGQENSKVDLRDVTDISDPLEKIQPGLTTSSDSPVPLRSVHVRAKLIDLSAQVVVLQEYHNESNVAIEAKYVFPLEEMAVVCGFEAFINGKHIIGEVKEKETAHKEYKKAISEGHGAYLMDQDEETPDVFTVSVGNLPPQASVLIKITYVAELQVEGENICFAVPGTVAPWKKDSALADVTQTHLDTVKIEGYKQKDVSIDVAIEMPFDIRSVTSPTHKIRLKKTLTKAVIEMSKNQELGDSFQIQIGLAEIHVPRMWACMLTFYPEFEAETREDFEVVYLLDLSNSMTGNGLVEAKKILLLALNHLPDTSYFNIVAFGTAFDELFPRSRRKTRKNISLAQIFIQESEANLGSSEVIRALQSYFLLNDPDTSRNIFLVSDGHISHEEEVIRLVKTNAGPTRIFTFGVSSTANRHTLRSLARVGAGAFECFDSKMKSRWESKVKRQLEKAGQPGLTSVQVTWQQFDDSLPPPVQAPSQITSLFNGSRHVIYGFVSNCTKATLKAVVGNREVSTMVSTSDLSITTGKFLHQLTARAVIRDWEEGSLADNKIDHEVVKKNRKELIIKLSTGYSIVTQFTSFVAIEKREKGEQFTKENGPTIRELVEKEAVDMLDYIGWETVAGLSELPETTDLSGCGNLSCRIKIPSQRTAFGKSPTEDGQKYLDMNKPEVEVSLKILEKSPGDKMNEREKSMEAFRSKLYARKQGQKEDIDKQEFQLHEEELRMSAMRETVPRREMIKTMSGLSQPPLTEFTQRLATGTSLPRETLADNGKPTLSKSALAPAILPLDTVQEAISCQIRKYNRSRLAESEIMSTRKLVADERPPNEELSHKRPSPPSPSAIVWCQYPYQRHLQYDYPKKDISKETISPFVGAAPPACAPPFASEPRHADTPSFVEPPSHDGAAAFVGAPLLAGVMTTAPQFMDAQPLAGTPPLAAAPPFTRASRHAGVISPVPPFAGAPPPVVVPPILGTPSPAGTPPIEGITPPVDAPRHSITEQPPAERVKADRHYSISLTNILNPDLDVQHLTKMYYPPKRRSKTRQTARRSFPKKIDFKITENDFESLAKLQEEDGSWQLDGSLGMLLIFRAETAEQILMEAGLKSLGRKVETCVLKLVGTLIVLIELLHYSNAEALCHPRILRDPAAYLKAFAMNVKWSVGSTACDSLRQAIIFWQGVDTEFPMLYTTLGLGTSWENAVAAIVEWTTMLLD